MEALVFVAPFVVVGIAVIVLTVSGGSGEGRRSRLRSRRGGLGGMVKVGVPVLVLVLGIVVPTAVIADRDAAVGGAGQLQAEKPSPELEEGKLLFGQNCASCHSLAAYNAQGATGPNLDELGQLSPERVRNAIQNGGTGDLRMPARLLEEKEADAVAAYVSKAAGAGQ